MVDEYPEISGITNAREAMKKMPEPDRARIAEQVSTLRFLTTFECKNINQCNWFRKIGSASLLVIILIIGRSV